MRSYRGMSPRTAAVAFVADRIRRPVADLDLDGIRAARTSLISQGTLFSAVTGRVHDDVEITMGTAPARDGFSIPLRIYRPQPSDGSRLPLPVIVYLHGGGWVLGNVINYDPLCSLLATKVGAVVVSVDYRLAPEHIAPTAALDAVDATCWVASHGEALGADGLRIGVCGDSAGGNLAAVVAQVMRNHLDRPIRVQALIYPATDVTMASPSLEEHRHGAILDRRAIDAFADHYCPPGVDRRDPLVSPLFGTLDGVAPALIQTADLDPIRDDGSRYAEALRAAGVPTRHTNYLGVPHGFASFPYATRVGRQQQWELVTELRAALAL